MAAPAPAMSTRARSGGGVAQLSERSKDNILLWSSPTSLKLHLKKTQLIRHIDRLRDKMSAPAVASAALKARVRRPSLYNKVVHPEDLIKLFPNGSYIGWSGFTGVGYPKYVV